MKPRCRICPGPACDQEYHEASARARLWFHENTLRRVELNLNPLPLPAHKRAKMPVQAIGLVPRAEPAS